MPERDLPAELEAELDKALQVFQTESAEKGKALAARAAVNFLKAGVPLRLLFPLVAIFQDIEDQESGETRKPRMEALALAQAAAAVDFLKTKGFRVDEAATKVSAATGGAINKKALIEFRKNLGRKSLMNSGGRRERAEAVSGYRHMRVGYTEYFKALPAENSVAVVLENMRDIVIAKKG